MTINDEHRIDSFQVPLIQLFTLIYLLSWRLSCKDPIIKCLKNNFEKRNMAENKTMPTDASVEDFIAAVENKRRKADAIEILAIYKELTGLEPVM